MSSTSPSEDRPGRPPVADVLPPGPPTEDTPPGPPPATPAAAEPTPRRRLDPVRRSDGTPEPWPVTAQVRDTCSGCGAIVGAPELHALFHDQLAALRADVDDLIATAQLDAPADGGPEWAT